MGPIILLDKSALQCLSDEEVGFLIKHYYIHIPPILILEILGDLSKYGDEKARAEGMVRALAKKLSPTDSRVSLNHRGLSLLSLLGGDVPLTWQIPVMGGKEIIDRYGRSGTFFDEQPEERALRRWRSGDFTPSENTIAERWREITTTVDLEKVKRLIKDMGAYDKEIQSLSELILKVDEALSRTGYQAKLIQWILHRIGTDERIERAVLDRYQAKGFKPLAEFAPYANHCCRMELAFSLGLANDLVGTRPTNQIDLEYLKYLPFCHIFSSGDKFLKKFSLPFLRGDQDFVDSMELKADLKEIATRWGGLTEEEKKDDAYNYGSYPPPNENSFTHRIWKKRMRPWTPGSGNRAGRMTEEEHKKLMEHLQPMLDAIDGDG